MAVAAGGFRRYATYGTATAAGVFTNTVFGFIVAYTYIALWDERPGLGGYDQAQALTFVWVSQSLLAAGALIGGGFQEEIQERIRTGDIAVDLYRPADLQAWWLAADLGRAGFQLLGRGVVPLVAGSLAFQLAMPADPLRWLLFLVSVLLGLVVSFAVRYLLGLAAFWLMDGSGINMMATVVSIFFSGMLLPLTVFPGGFGEFVRVMPWAAMLQVPMDVLLGKNEGAGGAARALGFQAGWALVLLGLGRLMQSAATQKVVVQGG
ncbi:MULTISPECIES: ABC-2 family transporter protein [unclassified Streptomyces]|uniref:ABC transporter permease n=1 Tax=unclassified Streptomyces TaxID=2593676 RepID=UPI001BEC7F42|nr:MULTISPECIES: ABC-2 family transporter protein [unclassified Streptomyces]MBT2402656.1 ABC-2 family transporter protein [Streptomyces sp. ISL-21]MBT2459256.1 ABC-2 family transporter protein [Streptomyces sp. ISL-86]MBT2611323.1 ABC-2 family transporter protein [Streptomyces sp. ISL-87]